jgi:hypothetical protein
MYNTNSSHILAHTAVSVDERRSEELDMVLPGWEFDELTGEEGGRYVREGDFPLDSEDEAFVSDEDWNAFLEMTYSDRQEWEDRF